MILLYSVLAFLVLTFSSFTNSRKFPKFSLVSNQGQTITETCFTGKKTIVAMFHLACPPAMVLMNDLDSLQSTIDTAKFQILAVLENTKDHLEQFYSDSPSMWKSLRIAFNAKPVRYPLLPECKTENIVKQDTNTLIGQHCRMLSRKVRTKDSPTIILVDQNGKMVKVEKGYISSASAENRFAWLKDFIMLN